MQKITTCLWFEKDAEQAVKYYTKILRPSKMGKITKYDAASAHASGMPAGSVMLATFTFRGMEFMALNGGTQFKFTPATSFVIHCETQAEVDRYWKAFSDGGQAMACGWITDKFGITWQVTPTILMKLINDKDKKKVGRVMEAMVKMEKLEIKPLLDAARAKK
jgi:predicted 3-demethylubiquinone-9 3-methyltransferase (glyoxalase superfamily)